MIGIAMPFAFSTHLLAMGCSTFSGFPPLGLTATLNGIVYCVPRIWPSKWITPLWAAGVRVFLEVVVVIEVSAIVLVAVAPHRIKPNRLMLQRQWL